MIVAVAVHDTDCVVDVEGVTDIRWSAATYVDDAVADAMAVMDRVDEAVAARDADRDVLRDDDSDDEMDAKTDDVSVLD